MTFTVGPARPRPGKVRPRPGPRPAARKIITYQPGPGPGLLVSGPHPARPCPQHIIEAWPGPARPMDCGPARPAGRSPARAGPYYTPSSRLHTLFQATHPLPGYTPSSRLHTLFQATHPLPGYTPSSRLHTLFQATHPLPFTNTVDYNTSRIKGYSPSIFR